MMDRNELTGWLKNREQWSDANSPVLVRYSSTVQGKPQFLQIEHVVVETSPKTGKRAVILEASHT